LAPSAAAWRTITPQGRVYAKARRNARHLQKLSVKYQISEFAHKTIVHGLP
jgi:hypothetical protein